MRKKLCVAACAAVLASLSAAPVFALGVGGGFSAGSGESRWYRESLAGEVVSDYENTTNIGGGLMIDAGKPESGYFTRLNIGLDEYSMRTGYKQSIARFNFSSTFCFVAVKKDFFRFWLGPQVGAHYQFGSTGYRVYDHDAYALSQFSLCPQAIYFYQRAKYNMAGADAGLVIGFDFDIRKYATITVSCGIKYGAAIGGMTYKMGGLFCNNDLVYSHGFDRFADIGVLFRFDDSGGEKKKEIET